MANRKNRRTKQAQGRVIKKRAEKAAAAHLRSHSLEIRPWTSFQLAAELEFQSEENREKAQQMFRDHPNLGTCYVNSRYQVWKQEVPSDAEGALTLYHLTIKRHDGAPVRDWEDVQRIKTELIGPECEGVEMYPAESRRIYENDACHLWVFESGYKFPFGFVQGPTADDDESTDLVKKPEVSSERSSTGGVPVKPSLGDWS